MDVTMPQLGETVTEGTITRWLKQVGDRVEADEPLFEVSTDKVDSEVPAPVGGVVTEILVPEGETVEVGTRLAVLGDQLSAPASAPPEGAPDVSRRDRHGDAAAPVAPAPEACAGVSTPGTETAAAAVRARRRSLPEPVAPAPEPVVASDPDRLDPPLTSPIVRRLVAERGLDARSIQGSGPGGRLTRKDVLDAAALASNRPNSAPPERCARGVRRDRHGDGRSACGFGNRDCRHLSAPAVHRDGSRRTVPA